MARAIDPFAEIVRIVGNTDKALLVKAAIADADCFSPRHLAVPMIAAVDACASASGNALSGELVAILACRAFATALSTDRVETTLAITALRLTAHADTVLAAIETIHDDTVRPAARVEPPNVVLVAARNSVSDTDANAILTHRAANAFTTTPTATVVTAFLAYAILEAAVLALIC